MNAKKNDDVINIDGKDYSLNDLSDNAKSQLGSIQFVMLNFNNLITSGCRYCCISYTNALKSERKN